MKGIFISHSTKDKNLVGNIIELLQGGMGIGSERIFCTSINGNLPTGEDFIQIIKDNMQECDVVLAIITPNYLKSNFCMMELGAAWISSQTLFPILANGIDFNDLDNTPLKKTQMRKCENGEDWHTIYDELLKYGVISIPKSYYVGNKIAEFLNKTKSSFHHTIQSDENGYFDVEISSIRNVPKPYRCYKIKGFIDLSKFNVSFNKNESQWLFFKSGTFSDLKKGNKVRIKVHSVKKQTFNDIGTAINIYLTDLIVLD